MKTWPSFDDCYECNWHMEGARRALGPRMRGEEIWCGAGRPEFYTGETCVTRSPAYEMAIYFTESPQIFFYDIGDNVYIEFEVLEWLRANCPGTARVEPFCEDGVVIRFASKELATIFKMFWL